MAITLEEKAAFLKDNFLFSGLEKEVRTNAAGRFQLKLVRRGVGVYQGVEPERIFFIVLSGCLKIDGAGLMSAHESSVLEVGDFYGEEQIFNDKPAQTNIRAIEDAWLLWMDEAQFKSLLIDYPEIKPRLLREVESREIVRKVAFNWVGSEESILLVARKHEMFLVFSLLPSAAALLAAAIIVYWAGSPLNSSAIWTLGLTLGGLIFVVAVLWALWVWIDWGNDYYILTDQRVVWIEQVIWLYDSQVEAPLTMLRSVDKRTSLLGRTFGYGNVIVTTYTGEIVLRNVGQPDYLEGKIREQGRRAQLRSQRKEDELLQQTIQQHLEQVDEETPDEPDLRHLLDSQKAKEPKHLSFKEKYLSNFFKLRYEDGRTITFRKFWIVLIEKTWMPFSAAGLLGLGLLYYFYNFLILDVQFLNPLLVLSVGVGVLAFGLFPWWLYNYWDWRNDIYQVTDKFIFDIERKPLGSEIKKSAPLESILSLEHSKLGFLGYLLNYGNVTISVGEDKFVFLGVHDPARVQQDIFERMYAVREEKRKVEAAHLRERIAQGLRFYHDEENNVEEDED